MSTENETQTEATIDAGQILTGGSITTPSGMHTGMIIDPVLVAGPPRYRLWDGAHHYDDLDQAWSREQARAMARGLRRVSRNAIRLVEITETVTELQIDEEATA